MIRARVLFPLHVPNQSVDHALEQGLDGNPLTLGFRLEVMKDILGDIDADLDLRHDRYLPPAGWTGTAL